MDIPTAEDDRKQRFRFHKDDEILLLEVVLQAQPCPYKISARDGTILVAWNKIAEEFKNRCKPRPEGNLPHSRTCRTRCDKMIIDFLAVRAAPHLRDKTKESKEEKVKNELLATLAALAGKIKDPSQGNPSGNPPPLPPPPPFASSSPPLPPSIAGANSHGINTTSVGNMAGPSSGGSTSSTAMTPGNVLAAAAAAAAVAGNNGTPNSGGLPDIHQHPHPLRGNAASSYLVHNPSVSGPSGHDSLNSALPTTDPSHILHNQGNDGSGSSNNNTTVPRQARSHIAGGPNSAVPLGFVGGGGGGGGGGSSKRGSNHVYNSYRAVVTEASVTAAPTPVPEKRGSNGSGKGEGHSAKRHRPSTGGKLPVSSAPAAVPSASSMAHSNQRHPSAADYHSSGRGARPNNHGPPQGQSESEEDEDEGEEEDDENEEEDEDDEDDANDSTTLNHHTKIGQRAEQMMDNAMNDDLDDYGNGYENDYGNDFHEDADPREVSSTLIQSSDLSKDPSSSSRRMNRSTKNFIATLRPYSTQHQQVSLETQTKEYIHSARSSSLSMAQSSSHRTSFGGEGGSSHNSGGSGAVGSFLGPSGKPLIVPSQVSAEDRVYLLRNLALEEQRVNVEVEKIALEREKLALERTRLQWEMRKSNMQ